MQALGGLLPARALAVLATGPAAGAALAFVQLLLRPPNAALSGGFLLGILDPADELDGNEPQASRALRMRGRASGRRSALFLPRHGRRELRGECGRDGSAGSVKWTRTDRRMGVTVSSTGIGVHGHER